MKTKRNRKVRIHQWLANPQTDLRVRTILTEAVETPDIGRFETREMARNEDMLRAKLAQNLSGDCQQSRSRKLRRLAKKIAPSQRVGKLSPTFASMRTMRRFRRMFCGQALDLLSHVPEGSISLYTLVPRGWRIPGPELMNFEPKKLIERLRSQLNRQGLPNLSGWLIAQVHGDYNPVSDHYQIHLHVLSVGNVGIAIEGLRGIAPYRSGEVKRPILRRAGTNLMSRVPYYVAQPFWPMKVPLPGGRRTSRRRLPPDRLLDWLVWIDEQRFSDLIWLHGCSIRRGRLVRNQS